MKITREQLVEDRARQARWDHLTRGLNETTRHATEVLMDNMAEEIRLHEGVTTANVGTFTTYALPLIRRIYPALLAPRIVGTQVMRQPTAKAFWLDSKNADGDRLDVAANFDRDYADTVESGTVKEVTFNISSTTVTAEQKKLKAIWTIESAQDLPRYHPGLSTMGELLGIVSSEIVREIDSEVILDLYTATDIDAGTTAGNVNWSATPPAGDTTTADKRAWRETLYDAIIDANTQIKTKRYVSGNFIITHPTNTGRLEKLEGFALAPNAERRSLSTGTRTVIGSLNGLYDVIEDPWHPYEYKMLLGHKGLSWLQTGYVFMPYIMAWLSPEVFSTTDFTYARGMMSRFGRKKVVGNLYATITITDT